MSRNSYNSRKKCVATFRAMHKLLVSISRGLPLPVCNGFALSELSLSTVITLKGCTTTDGGVTPGHHHKNIES